MKSQTQLLLQIFWTFFKISPVTFGGGFAMIPLIEREIVKKRKWLGNEDVTDVFALAQTVPGAVAINSATFIGHRLAGVKGAIAAMIGVSIPTFFIVLALGISYYSVHQNPKLEAAFMSIRMTIIAIIVYAAIKVAKTALIDKTTIVIMLVGVLALFFIHPVLAILLGAIAGVTANAVKKNKGHTTSSRRQHQQQKDSTSTPGSYRQTGV
ncbi:chromate transporter [Neobacillus citreus]|uniref:Chromate transporter n=1 Tax=Neobacillus citreus TaxID=2833578 RepID=A0A942T0U5_9BACI|nr:chromate transporter [Neobacillus citreus]MCH6265020.1 chromate transporter [Neobacillus citreus]